MSIKTKQNKNTLSKLNIISIIRFKILLLRRNEEKQALFMTSKNLNINLLIYTFSSCDKSECKKIFYLIIFIINILQLKIRTKKKRVEFSLL